MFLSEDGNSVRIKTLTRDESVLIPQIELLSEINPMKLEEE